MNDTIREYQVGDHPSDCDEELSFLINDQLLREMIRGKLMIRGKTLYMHHLRNVIFFLTRLRSRTKFKRNQS